MAFAGNIVQMPHPALVAVEGGVVIEALGADTNIFAVKHGRLDLVHHLPCNLVLKGQNVDKVPVEPVRPDMGAF